MKIKTIIAIIAAFALSVVGTAFVLAENEAAEGVLDDAILNAEDLLDKAVESVDDATESAVEEQRVIERRDRESRTSEFTVMFNDRLDGTEDIDDTIYFYRSVKDAVADYSDDYYCPANMDEGFVDIIYDARGVNKEGPVVFQIGYYYGGGYDMVWLYPGTGHFGTNPDAEAYASNGNTFYINSFNDGNRDGFISWGVIDGNTYQVHTATLEKAKAIIDSFEKAE